MNDASSRGRLATALPPQKKNSELLGSPIGQWQVSSVSSSKVRRWLIGTTLSNAIGSGSGSTSNTWARAVLPRDIGRLIRIMFCAGRTLRWRGAAEDGDLARPDRPRRWTLPITALRVMLPKLGGDLARPKARTPKVSSIARRDRRSNSSPSSHCSFSTRACASFDAASRVKAQNPQAAESLSPRPPHQSDQR